MSSKSEKTDKEICAICKRDIKELKTYPIYSKKHDDIICSHCCLIASCYHLKMLSKDHLKPIPEQIRAEIMTLFDDIQNTPPKINSTFTIKYNKQAEQDQKTRLLLREIQEVFNRYGYRDDIERELRNLGFYPWFKERDDYLWGLKEGLQNILIFISWINGEAWIYFRIDKINM